MRILDVMLDLETMGRAPHGAITAIGAICFNLDTQEVMCNNTDKFYRTVDLVSSASFGGKIDPLTIKWWLRQESKAQQDIAEANAPLDRALKEFTRFLTQAKLHYESEKICVWGNGANFDNTIIKMAAKDCGIKLPWTYKEDRCYRTMREMFPVPFESKGTKHNALDDAQAQAEHLIKIYEHYSIPIP